MATDNFVGLAMVGRLGNHLGTIAAGLTYAWDNNLRLLCPQLANLALPGQVDRILEPMQHNFQPKTFYWPRMCNDYLPVYERLLAEYPGIASPIPENKISGYLVHLQHAYLDYSLAPNTVFIGYFFNEKFFIHHRDKIKALFQPSDSLVAYLDHKYGSIINDPKSVGIHFRDFTNDGDRWVVMLSQQHFLDAIEQFDDSHHFVVCSNNLNRTKLFFDDIFKKTKRQVRYIEYERDFVDFYLLTRLKNLIISNSSFGWWSAYLCMHPEKRIIAPARDKWVLPHLQGDLLFLPETEEWTAI